MNDDGHLEQISNHLCELYPASPGADHFLIFSVVPMVVALLLPHVALAGVTALALAGSVILSVFALMMSRIPELWEYHSIIQIIRNDDQVPTVIKTYLRREEGLRRSYVGLCIINGFFALLFWNALNPVGISETLIPIPLDIKTSIFIIAYWMSSIGLYSANLLEKEATRSMVFTLLTPTAIKALSAIERRSL